MADRLYLKPSKTTAAVIEVGGVCYERIGESGQPAVPIQIESEHNTCDHCRGETIPLACGACCFSDGSSIRVQLTITLDDPVTPCCGESQYLSVDETIPCRNANNTRILWSNQSGTGPCGDDALAECNELFLNLYVRYFCDTDTWDIAYGWTGANPDGTCPYLDTVPGIANFEDATGDCCGVSGTTNTAFTDCDNNDGSATVSYTLTVQDNSFCFDQAGDCVVGTDTDCDGECDT